MLMGMAGAPFPYYIGYLEPGTAFGLSYGVNSIAMPMIGGLRAGSVLWSARSLSRRCSNGRR
jgi:hypothetical protein